MEWHRCGVLRRAVLYEVADAKSYKNLKHCVAAADGKVQACQGAPTDPVVTEFQGLAVVMRGVGLMAVPILQTGKELGEELKAAWEWAAVLSCVVWQKV